MTREEAKDYIREWCPYDRQEEIIKALQQEPCEDAVSKEEVRKILYYLSTGGLKAIEALDKLPPVTSNQRTGKWTKEESILGWDGKSYQCSACGRSIHLDTEVEDLTDYPYCHCGAKMIFDRTDDIISCEEI